MDELKAIVHSQMDNLTTNAIVASQFSNLTAESTRYLTQFKNSLLPVQTRAQATEHEHFRRQAEEAARKTQETVLSAIRLPIIEAAVQQALKSIKATLVEPSATSPVQTLGNSLCAIPGPKAVSAGIESALLTAENEIRLAISDFLLESKSHTETHEVEAFSAMLHAFKQTGVDTQVLSEIATAP